MQTPDLLSMDYVLPGLTSSSSYPTGYNTRAEPYTGLHQKPLQGRRRQFIVVIVIYLFIHLSLSVSLAVVVTRRSSRFSGAGQSGSADLWCSSQCRLPKDSDEAGLSFVPFKVHDPRKVNEKADLCCFERRDLFMKIYEMIRIVLKTKDFSEKTFDGICVKDRWTEDDINNWPRNAQSAISFDKQSKRFRVEEAGTYSLHSRLDFNCTRRHEAYRQRVLVNKWSMFEDQRLPSNSASSPMEPVYTSSIDVIVELKQGATLELTLEPPDCVTPRSIVVFQSKESS